MLQKGQLTFHYARWLSTNTVRDDGPEVILEVAFWIGPTPGTAPTPEMLLAFGDAGDTYRSDLWVVFHLHMPRNSNTFTSDVTANGVLSPGVSTVNIYHSQTLHSLGRQNPRAEFRFSSTYAATVNTGSLQNYNDRAYALRCPANQPWRIGVPSARLQPAENGGLSVEYAQQLQDFVSGSQHSID